MLPVDGGYGHNPSPKANTSPNPCAYPGEETVLGYGDFHVISGASQEDDDDGLLSCIFSQHHITTTRSGEELVTVCEDANPMTEGRGTEAKSGQGARKRMSGKTDRHSKIRTAQGLRDRRIRLSLQVSRKFFDLQDMLGFDKASSTIEWLIAKSRGAIKGLSMRKGGTSSKGGAETSECNVPRRKESGPILGNEVLGIEKGMLGGESSRGNTKRGSREIARVRAKERTRAKMMAKISEFSISEENPNNCPNFSASDGHRDFSSIEVIEKFLGIASASESSPHGDPTSSYYTENAKGSSDDRFPDSYHGDRPAGHFGGYYPIS
ncbi:hypothetical protein MLD38_004382 [Melastoma candidum]|uniref:Uncharacterized protein n=1 Tax=Melastoma candidum TaxID=119954 RepID=A0ACB9S8Q9_9MYRT|nr:hypothetical protein MLD38_004382 [Melastoma candidum]